MAVTGEFVRPGLGADGRAEAITADVRAYLPLGLPHAVLAARAALAASTGGDDVQRRFRLGGSDGNPSAGAFGSDAISLLRGFQDDVFVGDRVALVNIEARMPLLVGSARLGDVAALPADDPRCRVRRHRPRLDGHGPMGRPQDRLRRGTVG